MLRRTMAVVIHTERTILREFVEDDVSAFFTLGNHPEIVRFTADPGGGFRNLEHARDMLISHPIADYAKYGFGRLAVVHREDDRVIGFCGLKYLEEFGEPDLGYRLHPDYWGQGLATETARAAMNWGFEKLELDRIMALVLPANTASIRVLEKLGMKLTDTIDYSGESAYRYVIHRST